MGIPVVVTTLHRGVFFGYLPDNAADGFDPFAENIELVKVRNCVYWAASVKGFLGLTHHGPNKECRIGPPAERAWIRNVTLVARATDEAAREWEKGHWGK